MRIAAAGLMFQICLVPVALAGEISVEGAYVRETPPMAQAAAAFMTLKNDGEANVLISAATPGVKRAELHNHINDDGVMRMREVEGGIKLPAGESVSLQPGGLHVMLMGLEHGFKSGEMVDLTLEFASGERMELTVPVKKITAMRHGAGHGTPKHMDHGKAKPMQGDDMSRGAGQGSDHGHMHKSE